MLCSSMLRVKPTFNGTQNPNEKVIGRYCVRTTAKTARENRIDMLRVFFDVKSVALVIVNAIAPAATTVMRATAPLMMARDAVPPPKKAAVEVPKLPMTPLMTFTTSGMATGTAYPSIL